MPGLKLAMAAVPVTDERLAAITQIGVRHLVHYDMSNDAAKFGKLPPLIARAAAAGLDVPVVEAGPPIDKIVLWQEGAAEQITSWREAMPVLASLGVRVVCYNFMPQVLDDAMVVRTSNVRTRGGAITMAFSMEGVGAHPPGPHAITSEQMRRNLGRFLEAVLPEAERAGIRLAMHPDDPPISPLGGYHRIMSSVDDMKWLLEFSASRANALTLCAGCVGEMGEDPAVFARRHADRIAFVHLRNIRGTPTEFVETWPDDGDLDLPGLLATLVELDVDVYARPDHAPRLSTENSSTPGYGFDGHVFSMGYYRGILDTLRQPRRSGAEESPSDILGAVG